MNLSCILSFHPFILSFSYGLSYLLQSCDHYLHLQVTRLPAHRVHISSMCSSSLSLSYLLLPRSFNVSFTSYASILSFPSLSCFYLPLGNPQEFLIAFPFTLRFPCFSLLFSIQYTSLSSYLSPLFHIFPLCLPAPFLHSLV